MSISSTLINWYLQKKRNLPWRNSSNPYEIWVSEIILQQTRVAQGTSYYHHFLERFPTVESLATADIEDVLKVWQGLGYYSRARNMHAGAKYVLQQHKGDFPPNYQDLLKIKGVGEYTAAAIGSFVFNIPVAVVDGNVNRVIARILGIHDPVNSSAGSKKIKDIADKILDASNPGIHNQAIMEFGALQCTVKNPDCAYCPLQSDCYAFIHNEVSVLPQKIKPQKVRDRYFNYLIIKSNDNIYLRKRAGKDIWHGLYEFPLIESDKALSQKELQQSYSWNAIFQGNNFEIVHSSDTFKHKLSHQTIHATFHIIKVSGSLPDTLNDTMVIKKEEIVRFPVSKLIENFISTYTL
jgi:A/G-specific adenine glycosylase